MRVIRRFTVRVVLPEPIAALGRLSRNLRWAWHPPTQDLFASIDPGAWARLRDPARLLGSLAPGRLDLLAADPEFVARVAAAAADLDAYLSQPHWYQTHFAEAGDDVSVPRAIAYFSAEFGITAALPQYSGGLGILAGDHLKSASDLGVPVVGVGLLYQSGYFRQSLSRDGWQQESYPVQDPDGMPLSLLREADGSPAQIALALPGGGPLFAHVWTAEVGRVPLLLLDSDVPANDEALRRVTDRLYGGGAEHRLLQEILLGVGGVRALRAWSRITGAPAPEVFHANEGHAGFLGLERLRELTAVPTGGAPGTPALTFDQALAAVRGATVFTTHTPVPAGIDRFPADLVRGYFSAGLLGAVPVDRVLALGAEDYPGGDPATFNMAVMGLRLAQRANGVAKLHGAVSRSMFAGLWPGFDVREVPIGSVTNGVHAPTWVDRQVTAAAVQYLGQEAVAHRQWHRVAEVPDRAVWELKRALRAQLVAEARRRVHDSWLARGASPAELGWTDTVLDPDVLTIGFARRSATYKRLTLMMRDPDRLRRLLLDPERPVQIVVAGKAHPADDGGKRLIQQVVKFADDPAVRHRIVFLPNYDMDMARYLYPGCDVWLNNPLRPLEACGTSGMKAAMNGGLNLSVLDGWWDEMFDGEVGWAIPTADGVTDPARRDDVEAQALYDLVENQVVPRFYDRDGDGVPERWTEMVKHTFATLGPAVDAERMVRDYVTTLYLPACRSGRALAADGGARAVALAGFAERVRAAWPGVRVDHVESGTVSEAAQIGDVLQVRSYVSLGTLTPDDVRVEVLFGRVDDGDRLIDPVAQTLSVVEAYEDGRYQFAGEVELRIPGSFGYSVRVVPEHPDLASVADLGLVANAG